MVTCIRRPFMKVLENCEEETEGQREAFHELMSGKCLLGMLLFFMAGTLPAALSIVLGIF